MVCRLNASEIGSGCSERYKTRLGRVVAQEHGRVRFGDAHVGDTVGVFDQGESGLVNPSTQAGSDPVEGERWSVSEPDSPEEMAGWFTSSPELPRP
jgi:hypothetical protein